MNWLQRIFARTPAPTISEIDAVRDAVRKVTDKSLSISYSANSYGSPYFRVHVHEVGWVEAPTAALVIARAEAIVFAKEKGGSE